jgi:hypothetical protein
VQSGEHWPSGTVYYAISSNIASGSSEATGVNAAISAWNYANSTNGINVTFEPATAQNPAVLTIENLASGTGYFGYFTPGNLNSNGTLQSATIDIYINATLPGGRARIQSLRADLQPSDPAGGRSRAWTQHGPQRHAGHMPEQMRGGSVMDMFCGTNDADNNIPNQVTPCDASVAKAFQGTTGKGGTGGGGGGPVGCEQQCGSACMDGMTCGEGFTPECLGNTPQCACTIPCGNACLSAMTCPLGGQPECEDEDEGWIPVCPEQGSPIIIDAFGEGFHLTNVPGGVQFRVLPGDPLEQMSWTDQRWRNGWLALDRNGNGLIDNFTELFGNLTPQPPGSDPNGYIALAVFDDPANGGNGNGKIHPGDAVYDHLLLWIDSNHNGISEPGELYHLRDVGIFAIDLHYELARYVDQYGNQFRYKAKAWDEAGQEHDMCYDVFLQMWGKPTQQ